MYKLRIENDGDVVKKLGKHTTLGHCAQQAEKLDDEFEDGDDCVATDEKTGERFVLEMGAWWPENGGGAVWAEDRD